MPTSDEWNQMSGEAGIVLRPRIGLADILVQLWRAKWLMLLVFLPIFALGLVVAFSMPTKYKAQSRIIVSLGEEYVFNPDVGDPSPGLAADLEEVTQSELELLLSPIVIERVLSRFPMERVYPDLAKSCEEKIAASGNVRKREALSYTCFQTGVSTMQRNFSASATPKSTVILTNFEHEDPAMSAEILNAIVKTYQSYRSEIFTDHSSEGLGMQRRRLEAQLSAAENAIRSFLVENNIGDFESESETVRQLYMTASGELLANETRISQVDGQLKIYRQQLKDFDRDINLYVEDNSNVTLQELELEREELLTRYKPDSRPVQAIEKRIANVKAFLDTRTGPVGTVRRGPNPVFQEIETAVSNLEAEAMSLSDQHTEVRNQLARLEARQMQLAQLEPDYQRLLRERDLLAAQATSFREREVEATSRSELFKHAVDNIRVLEPARPPVEGSSLKLPVAFLALLFAGFTALMAGLLRALTREGFSTARSVERTTGLPVLASVGKH